MGLRSHLAVLAATLASAHPAPASPLAAHSMVYLNAPAAFQEAMFQSAAAMGASTIRLDLQVNHVTDSAQGLGDYDRVLSYAARYRLPVTAVITGTPRAWRSCPTAAAEQRPFTCPVAPRSLDAWAATVARLAARGRPVVTAVEIVNEPDRGPWTFAGTPEQYGQMLAAAGRAVHATVPGVPVLNGGVVGDAGSKAWLDRALTQPGAREAIDVANVHLRAPLDQGVRITRSWREWWRARGVAGPLWITEFGYPSDPAHQYDAAYAGGEAAQAAYLRDALPPLVCAGAAKVFVTLRDNLDGAYASEGVVGGAVFDRDMSHRPPAVRHKPALTALAELAAAWPNWWSEPPVADSPSSAPPAVKLSAPRRIPARRLMSFGLPVRIACPGRCRPRVTIALPAAHRAAHPVIGRRRPPRAAVRHRLVVAPSGSAGRMLLTHAESSDLVVRARGAPPVRVTVAG